MRIHAQYNNKRFCLRISRICRKAAKFRVGKKLPIPHRSATVWCRMSSAVADSGTVQAISSLAMATIPRLNVLTTSREGLARKGVGLAGRDGLETWGVLRRARRNRSLVQMDKPTQLQCLCNATQTVPRIHAFNSVSVGAASFEHNLPTAFNCASPIRDAQTRSCNWPDSHSQICGLFAQDSAETLVAGSAKSPRQDRISSWIFILSLLGL